MQTNPQEILGYAKLILDTWGVTPFIVTILFIGAASYVYRNFIRKD